MGCALHFIAGSIWVINRTPLFFLSSCESLCCGCAAGGPVRKGTETLEVLGDLLEILAVPQVVP